MLHKDLSMGVGRLFNTLDTTGPLFLRLGLAAVFIAHGGQKLFGWFGGAGLEASLAYFEQTLGIPMIPALLAMVAEFFGAMAILLGLLTRVAALGLTVVMAVAIFRVHLPYGFFLNWPCMPELGHGIEFNLALAAMSLSLVVTGPGKYSVDKWISEL